MSPAGAGRRLRPHLPALAGFALVTTGFFWQGIRHFGSRVMGAGGDGSTFMWAYEFMPEAALRLENPFVTDRLFHPVGANLAFHTSTPSAMVASWPIAELFGVGIAVNVLELVAVLLSAVGAYLLAFRVCGHRGAAFFAGVAFAFVPFRFSHFGHLNLIHVEVLPFGLLALLRLLERPSRGRAVALGAMVGVTFLTDVYLTVFLLLAVAVVLATRRAELSWEIARRLAEGALVAGVISLPLVLVMIGALRAGELDPLPGWGGADRWSADLVSWFVPSERHRLWGSAVKDVREGLRARGEGLVYPGLVVLALAVAGREIGDRARRRGWVALAVVGGLLASGPFLQVGGRSGSGFEYLGREFAVPLPYLGLHFVPVLNAVRVPGRFAILAILALDVLAALALASIARRWPSRGALVIGAAVALVLVEFLSVPVPTFPRKAPAPYEAIAADPDPGAVLEIPLQWQSGTALVGDRSPPRENSIFLYWATFHRKAVVSGHISRYPDKRLDRLKSIPVYRQVLSLMDEPGYDDAATFGADDLRELGISFVVYHRDRPEPAVLEYVERLDLELLADDGRIVVWKVNA